MTGTSNSRSGDTLAAIRPENVRPRDERVVDPDARATAFQVPAWSPTHWPKNVLPFTRARYGDGSSALVLDPAARPAPPGPTEQRRRIAAFLTLSLALHTALYAAFWEEPKPLASVGVESITVDLVLGGNTEAGLATTPGEADLQAAPADEVKPEDEPVEQERAPETRPETPVAEREIKPDEASDVKPEEQQPVEKKEAAQQPKQSSAGAPSNTASGIGRGRSDSDANYRGQVAAHLTRHKQYPAAARRNRDEGTATVSFTIDGSGRVTAAKLVRGSGHASLDHEVEAMVRRASPFPSPPGRRTMSFTVPITFKLQ